jgi:hypothetical protein
MPLFMELLQPEVFIVVSISVSLIVLISWWANGRIDIIFDPKVRNILIQFVNSGEELSSLEGLNYLSMVSNLTIRDAAIGSKRVASQLENLLGSISNDFLCKRIRLAICDVDGN